MELLIAAVAGAKRDAAIELNDVRFERVLWMERPILIQTSHEDRSRTATVNVRAIGGSDWYVHCRAHGGLLQQQETASKQVLLPEDLAPLDLSALYKRFEHAGHFYGPSFRALQWAGTKANEFWGRLILPPALQADAGSYFLHPAMLDAALQLALSSVPMDEEREPMYLPITVDRVRWLRPAGREAICHIHNVHEQDVRWYVDVDLYSPDGEIIASLEGCCCLKKEHGYRLAASPVAIYQEAWVEARRQKPD